MWKTEKAQGIYILFYSSKSAQMEKICWLIRTNVSVVKLLTTFLFNMLHVYFVGKSSYLDIWFNML